MNQEQENFEALQRLLKLKRYEQPPPGYFGDFSTQVVRRIKLGGPEDKEGILEYLFIEAPWLQRLFGAFQAKPAVAWSFGLAACALVVSSIVYSETVEYSPVSVLPTSSEADRANAVVAVPMTLAESSAESLESLAALSASTNPVIQPIGGSLFDQYSLHPQPVSGFAPLGR